MKTLPITIFLLFASTIPHLRADADADALKRLALLPNAPLVITVDQASGSPSVILTAKGALINKSTTPVPFDQVLSKLAALPAKAWPYGRVLYFSPAPVDGSGESAPPQSVADKVQLDLQKANIRLLHSSG